MFRVVAIDHLVLRVVDLNRMLHFYCDALGCAIEKRQDDLGLIQLRAGNSLIDLVPVDGKLGRAGGAPPGKEGRNLDHFCLRVEPFDEAAIREQLARHGYAAGAVAQRYGAEGEGPSLYVSDPEGNVVELKGPPDRGPESKVLAIRLSVELGSSAENVWPVTGSFAGLADWHPWVESCVLEPAAGGIGRRVIHVGGTAGRRDLVERLLHFDAAAREYAYTIIAGPAPFIEYVGRLRVTPRGKDRCVFEYFARFKPAPGKTEAEAAERIRTFYEAGLANLRRLFGI